MIRAPVDAVRRSPGAALLGLVAFVAIAGPVAWRYGTATRDQLWVDLDVYRDAGRSVLIGEPVYAHLTPVPQLLPFTYPAVSAVLAAPLVVVPFRALGWAWTVMQLLLLAGIVATVFRPALQRCGRWGPVALAIVAGSMAWLLPIMDGLKFGQVNLILIALVLADYLACEPRWPRGLLIGLATAVKLTPGVFIVHLWLVGRRREAMTAALSAVGFTVAAFLVIPGDSADFWFRAIFDSDRLGNNTGTSNQSIRGMLLRLGPDSALLWLALAALVAVYGFRHAVRATEAGHEIAGIAITGLLAALLSPVAWIHHLTWVVLVIAVVLGRGTDRRRVVLAAAIWAFFVVHVPWYGSAWSDDSWCPILLARFVQDGYGLAAIGLIPLLSWAVRRDRDDGVLVGPGSPPFERRSAGSRPTEPVPAR